MISSKKKNVCFFVYLVVSFFVLQNSSYALIVPPDECPRSPNPVMMAPCYSLQVFNCERIDSGIVQVYAGVSASHPGGRFVCDNCSEASSEVTPPPMSCVQTLTVEYTESVTVTIAQNIEASSGTELAALKASLEASIGHNSARSVSISASCGSNNVQGGTIVTYGLDLDIMKNAKKQITHTYRWVTEIRHHSGQCQDPQHSSVPPSQINYIDAGTSVSTVTGSYYGSARCKAISVVNCY